MDGTTGLNLKFGITLFMLALFSVVSLATENFSIVGYSIESYFVIEFGLNAILGFCAIGIFLLVFMQIRKDRKLKPVETVQQGEFLGSVDLSNDDFEDDDDLSMFDDDDEEEDDDEPIVLEGEVLTGPDEDNSFLYPEESLFKVYPIKLTSDAEILKNSKAIQGILRTAKIETQFQGADRSPRLNRYKFSLGAYKDTKANGSVVDKYSSVSKVASLLLDIGRELNGVNVSLQPLIEGTKFFGLIGGSGISGQMTGLGNLFSDKAYQDKVRDLRLNDGFLNGLPIVVGLDAGGEVLTTDIAKFPNCLVAGTTGSGKSVFINSVVSNLISTHSPDSLTLYLADPKRVELTHFKDVPHLGQPIVKDIPDIVTLFEGLHTLMEQRYLILEKDGSKNIEEYNAKKRNADRKMPYVVAIVDELNDILGTEGPGEKMELVLQQLLQKARASGIHSILCAQRLSTKELSNSVKVNAPVRIVFKMSSQADSGVMGVEGAEHLAGKGDGIFKNIVGEEIRFSGAMVSDKEIANVIKYWKGG